MTTAATTDHLATVRAQEYGWSGAGVYLNAASFGPLPERTVRAVESVGRRRQHPFDFPDALIGETLDRARRAAARLVGGGADEIALGPNTSVGLNLAAGIAARPRERGGLADATGRRRRIVVSAGEFPANVYPWLRLRQEGFEVDLVPADPLGRPDEAALLERLERDDVAVLALSAVQFATGWRADLERFGRVCRERGVLFVVDAIQALGAVPLDVRAAGIDILSSGAQKWLCSPWGTGFTYVKRELAAGVEPLQTGWLAYASCADFTRLLDYDETLVADARRFEVGSLAVEAFAGMAHSIELLLEIGIEKVWSHIQRVQAPLLEWVDRSGVERVGDADPARRSGIVCIRPRDADAVHAALRDAGVVCVVREGAIRFSPHFFNTVREMEQVVEVLDQVVAR